jgi:hypothetical protein
LLQDIEDAASAERLEEAEHLENALDLHLGPDYAESEEAA